MQILGAVLCTVDRELCFKLECNAEVVPVDWVQ